VGGALDVSPPDDDPAGVDEQQAGGGPSDVTERPGGPSVAPEAPSGAAGRHRVRRGAFAAVGAALCQVAVLGLLSGTNGATAGSGTERALQGLSLVLLAVAVLGVHAARWAGTARSDQIGGLLLVLVVAVVVAFLLKGAIPALVGERGPFWLHDAIGEVAVGLAGLPLGAYLFTRSPRPVRP